MGPSIIVLMENVDSGKQADIEATMIGYATPLFEEAKAKKEDPAFCFLTGKSAGGICDRVRELVKAGAANDKPQMFLLTSLTTAATTCHQQRISLRILCLL